MMTYSELESQFGEFKSEKGSEIENLKSYQKVHGKLLLLLAYKYRSNFLATFHGLSENVFKLYVPKGNPTCAKIVSVNYSTDIYQGRYVVRNKI